MRCLVRWLLLSCLSVSCAHQAVVPPDEASGVVAEVRSAPSVPALGAAVFVPSEKELWVDAHASAEGSDGTKSHPIPSLAEALLLQPSRIHLSTGLYPGPFVLPPGTSLKGSGQVVLFVEPSHQGAAVTSEGPFSLEGVTVQGGTTGIHIPAGASVKNVKLSGQRGRAIDATGGRVELRQVHADATVSEGVGLRLAGDVHAEFENVRLTGPFQRGLEMDGKARVLGRALEATSAFTAVHQTNGASELDGVRVGAGRGSGIVLAGGTMRLRNARVFKHEYALFAQAGTRLSVDHFASTSSERAGVALVKATADLRDVFVANFGSYGAVQLVDADTSLADLVVSDGEEYGVQAVRGKLRLQHARIRNVRDASSAAGDGLHLRGVEAHVEDVILSSVLGSGIVAAQGTKLVLRDAVLQSCNWSGIFAETGATVEARNVEVSGTKGPAVVVPNRSSVEVIGLDVSGSGGQVVMAECGQGAKVKLRSVTGTSVAASPCVRTE